METTDCQEKTHKRKNFCFIFEDERFSSPKKALTPAEIRRIAGGISEDIPIVICKDDGKQETLPEGEKIKLENCKQFRRLPRFKRG